MKRVYDIVHVIIVYHQWIMYCGTKNFEYDITTLTRENVHSERCIQQNTVLSFDDFKVRMRKSYSNVLWENRTQTFYGCKVLRWWNFGAHFLYSYLKNTQSQPCIQNTHDRVIFEYEWERVILEYKWERVILEYEWEIRKFYDSTVKSVLFTRAIVRLDNKAHWTIETCTCTSLKYPLHVTIYDALCCSCSQIIAIYFLRQK
jgi:hypothetical protein